MASQAPPSVPPRPARAKSPQSIPAIPPRPARPTARTKPSAENVVLPPSPSLEREPTPKTISPSTELHAPVVLPSRPAAVLKTESEQSSIATTPTFSKVPEDREKEEGIPQIGRRVPMYPNAGDVQAPTPSETPSNGRKKHVYREEWERNEGAYGSKRRETPYSMSSTDLNAVVAQPASANAGINEKEHGVPDEELGYLASDQYTQALSRSQSPARSREQARASLDGNNEEKHTDEEGNVIHLEDPSHGPGYFRRGNSDQVVEIHHDGEGNEEERDAYSILAADEILKRQQGQYMQAAVYIPSYTPRQHRSRPQSAQQERSEDAEVAPLELNTTLKGGCESRDSIRTSYEELSPEDANAKPLFPESDDERGELKAPLVERLKRPGLAEHRFPSNDVWEEAPDHAQLEATVETSPLGLASSAGYDDHEEAPDKEKSDEPILQYIKGQPHEHYQPGDEQEYERKQKEEARKDTDYRLNFHDLPEDERLRRLHKPTDGDVSPNSPRKDAHRRKFPSNDIWEDVPPSLDLQEELEPSVVPEKGSTAAPEKERATTGDISAVPEMSARPSTGAPIEAPSPVVKSTPLSKPSIPARPSKEKKIPQSSIHERAGLFARQHSPDKKPTPPSVPDRPKPAVPTRPGKLVGFMRAPSEEKPEPKPKPPIPPRTGGKIAALKAGLGDLESRLRLGPTVPKKEEKKEEELVKEEPLADVRKSRARGPRGRKLPTAAPAAREPVEEKPRAATSEIVGIWTVFTLDEDLDAVLVNTTLQPVSPAAAPAVFKHDVPPVSVTTPPATDDASPVKSEDPLVPKSDSPALRQDDTPEKDSALEVREEKEEKKLSTITPTTATLPDVSGTGQQELVVAQVEPLVESENPVEKKEENSTEVVKEQPAVPEEKVEEKLTAIPTSEHPEDAAIEKKELAAEAVTVKKE